MSFGSTAAQRKPHGFSQAAKTGRYPALKCPSCTVLLRLTVDSLCCTSCGRKYAVDDGIIQCAARQKFYYHNIAPDIMNSYLANIERLGWPRAFYELQRSVGSEGERVFASAEQGHLAGWKFLLPIHRTATVLVLGAGIEIVPLSLASSTGSVVVVDATQQRLCSLQAIAEFRRKSNISYIHARTLDELPFLDAYFDLIIISDLQDWIRQFSPSSPRAIPLVFLKALCRFLKPDGALYVAGDNRFTYTGLMGSDIDDNGFVVSDDGGSGGSALKRARKSSTSSHSYRGYQRRLREAGMRSQRIFGPVPDHRKPREMVDLSRSGTVTTGSSQRLGSFLRERLKVNPHFLKAFGHSFAVLASTSDKLPQAYLERLFEEMKRRLRLDELEVEELLLKDYEAAIFCRSGSLKLLVRLPYKISLAQLTLKNAEVLKRLNSRQIPHVLADVLPTWLYHGQFEGQVVAAETVSSGLPLEDGIAGIGSEELCDQLSVLLHAMSSVRGSNAARTGAPLVEQMADTISPRLIDPQVRSAFYGTALQVCELVRRAQLPGILVHGAFNLRNLLWDERHRRISGLVNWHGSMQHGLPGWDLLCFESAVVQNRCQCSVGDSILWLIENGSPPEYAGLWARYSESHRIAKELRPALLLSYWIGCVWREFLSDLAPLNHRWLRYNLINVLGRAESVLRSARIG